MAEGKTAFVLAGGGSHGAFVVGMLREIVRAGVAPDFVVGASAGAIDGAYFAGHPKVEGVARLEEIWCRLTTESVFGPRWHSFVSVLRRRDYLFAAKRLRALLEAHLAFRDLAEARLPCMWWRAIS
jgi:NTE family protein